MSQEFEQKDDTYWHNKEDTLDNLGRHEDALECYDKALEINPEEAV